MPTKKELVRFLHATYFYPIKNTWIAAIKNGNHATFSGLTLSLVNQHLLPETPETQDNQNQRRFGILLTIERHAMVTLTQEPAACETFSTVVDLPHLMCTHRNGKLSV